MSVRHDAVLQEEEIDEEVPIYDDEPLDKGKQATTVHHLPLLHIAVNLASVTFYSKKMH
jgi:hypothetical protein